MKNEEIYGLWNSASRVAYLSETRGLNAELYYLAIRCLCRTPLASYKTIEEFIETIRKMIESGLDYTLLLKAGILTGQFPDYCFYKQKKAFEHKKAVNVAQIYKDLEVIKERLGDEDTYISTSGLELYIKIDCNWLIRLKILYVNLLRANANRASIEQSFNAALRSLDSRKKKLAENIITGFYSCIDYDDLILKYRDIILKLLSDKQNEIQRKLHLKLSEWEYGNNLCPNIDINDSDGYCVTIHKKDHKEFKITTIKDNKYDSDLGPNLFSPPSCISYSTPETEEMTFISIFQNHIGLESESRFYSTNLDLKHYFERKYHLDSSVYRNKYNAFIKRYYRLINKFYTNDFLQTFWANPNEVDGVEIPAHTLGVLVHGKRNIFYIRHGKIKQIGTMEYNKKTRQYFIMEGTMLSENIDKIDDVGVYEFFNKNIKNICKIESSDKTITGYRELRKINVSSPSKAAWLIRGYKCNGPDCWKNSRGETLRQYLESFKKALFKRARSRFASDVQKDQEEHPTTP